MFLQSPLLWTLSSCLIALAIPLQSIEDSALKLSPVPTIVKPETLLNASVSPLETSGENALNIQCDGDTYGYNPSILDCEDAQGYLPSGTQTFAFSERHAGLPLGTIPLPFRVMGSQALCYFQTVLIGDPAGARATFAMVRRAATALVGRCAKGTVSQGGIATNIGQSEAKLLPSIS